MKKLYEILALAPIKGDVGIEIECEGSHFKDIEDPRWNSMVDNSLRGENREYVLSRPVFAKDVPEVLLSLQKELVEFGTKLDFSFRTSVHIHINVQQLTLPQYLNFIYTYMLLEEPLMTYCGDERKGNRFCLRLQDAEGMMQYLLPLFRNEPEQLRNIVVDRIRYSALNIGATKDYGSLEFRGMRGNLDLPVINTWVKALLSIREFACRMENPLDILGMFAAHSPEDFMRIVLGKEYKSFTYPNVERDIQKNFSLSLDLPYMFRDNANKPQQRLPEVVGEFAIGDIVVGTPEVVAAHGEIFAAEWLITGTSVLGPRVGYVCEKVLPVKGGQNLVYFYSEHIRYPNEIF